MAFTADGFNPDEFKVGGPHEKATWNWEAISVFNKKQENPGKPVSRRPVAGSTGCLLTSNQESGKQKNMGQSITVP
jgi:hypothetical protein